MINSEFNIKSSIVNKKVIPSPLDRNSEGLKLKKFEYEKSKFYFLCKRGKNLEIVRKLNIEYRKTMDIRKLFSIIKKSQLTENLLFDEKTRKIKNLIFNHQILENNEPNQKENFKFEKYFNFSSKDLISLRDDKNNLEINKPLYNKLKQLNLV
jgi:hypothetical protein